jgi:hypothetical protein
MHGCCLCPDLPRNRPITEMVPIMPTQYPPLSQIDHPAHYNTLKLVQLACFEATYHQTLTPLTPGMYPIVIDTGASATITPCLTDFVQPPQPVQHTEIKGIASGLAVESIGTVAYTFINNDQKKQVLTLANVLYVPTCTSRLLCPRQIGHTTGNPTDGFHSTMDKSILTMDGKRTTMLYDTTTQLPIFFTAPGITSFKTFCANNSQLASLPLSNSPTSNTNAFHNMSHMQWHKQQLHECCNHVSWAQLNAWISQIQFVPHANLGRHTSGHNTQTHVISQRMLNPLVMAVVLMVWRLGFLVV